MKRLIISCDDFGVSKEINLAIKDCAQRGLISSTSIVISGDFYEHALNDVVTQIPLKVFGIHLNLTEGKAICNRSRNLIADEQNFFNISAKKYFLYSFSKPKKDLKIAIYNEFKSQIEKAISDGLNLSHFDSHEHIHHCPWIFKIISDLGKEFKIRRIRFVNEKIVFSNFIKDFYHKFISLNYLKYLIVYINNKKIKNNFLSTDYFFGILNSGKVNLDELILYLDKISSNKSIEVCLHPSEEVVNKSTNKREFYYHLNRKLEKNLITNDEFKDYLKKEKIKLINFSDIN